MAQPSNHPGLNFGVKFMAETRAIMFTMTTYGTWLRGDRRGWVDDGIVFPADPDLNVADRQ